MLRGVGGGGTTGLQSFSNFNRTNLLRWRVALAAAREGDSNAIVACIGDSNATGHGAGTDSATGYVNAARRNMPYVLSKLMGSSQQPIAESTWGTQNLSLATWATFDPRFSVGSSWSIASALDPSLGGFMWLNTGTGTPWSFTPDFAYDTVDIYYIANNSGLSNAAVSINGVAQTAINPNTGTALQKVTYTQTLGTGAITITPTSGTFYMVGIETYNSAKKGVIVRNWAYDGGRATNFNYAGSVWSHLSAVKKLAPHLIIYQMMINDWNTATLLSAYQTAMNNIVSNYLNRVSGVNTTDVIIATCFPTSYDTVNRTAAALALYYGVNKALSNTYNLGFIDNLDRLGGAGTYTTLQSLGFTYNDYHLSAAGYADQAAAYETALKVLA